MPSPHEPTDRPTESSAPLPSAEWFEHMRELLARMSPSPVPLPEEAELGAAGAQT